MDYQPRSHASGSSRHHNRSGFDSWTGRRLLSVCRADCLSQWFVCRDLRPLRSDAYDGIPERRQRSGDTLLPPQWAEPACWSPKSRVIFGFFRM